VTGDVSSAVTFLLENDPAALAGVPDSEEDGDKDAGE
jgi:hypothetical protein